MREKQGNGTHILQKVNKAWVVWFLRKNTEKNDVCVMYEVCVGVEEGERAVWVRKIDISKKITIYA